MTVPRFIVPEVIAGGVLITNEIRSHLASAKYRRELAARWGIQPDEVEFIHHPHSTSRRLVPMLLAGSVFQGSQLYAIHFDDSAAIMSGSPADVHEFPPLPFPKMSFELYEDATWMLGMEVDGEGGDMEVEAFVVQEMIEGEEWGVCYWTRPAGGQTEEEFLRDGDNHNFMWVRIRPEGVGLGMTGIRPGQGQRMLGGEDIFANADAFEWEPISDPESYTWRLAVEMIHFVTARGVIHADPGIPRQHRRQYERRYKTPHPTTYVVKVGPTVVRDHDGDYAKTDRHLHVRFLVRGHWRHYRTGKKTWVHGYVKGPANAPFRGVQVRVPEGEGEPD